MAPNAEPISSGSATVSTAEADPQDAALLESLLSGVHANASSLSLEAGKGRFNRPLPGAPVLRTVRSAGAAAMGADERMELIQGCQGIVRSLAWKIHRKLPQNIDLDDLIAYGQVGLAQAARDFDPAVGGKFTTYAYWRVRGAILDGLSQMSWFKRQDFHASKYEVQRSGGADSESSASGATPVDKDAEKPRDIEAVADRPRVSIKSIGSDSPEEVDFTGAGSVADVSTRPPPTQSMMREMMEHVRKSIELLPPESATLIRAAYFEGVTLHEAGRRLGISRAWTSRLHAKALEKLARQLRSHWSGD